MTHTLMILIGIPASGKTTFRKTLHGYKVVCPDEIRKQIFHTIFNKKVEPLVWKCVRLQVLTHLRNRQNVVLDATNLVSPYRTRFLKIAEKYKARTYAIIFDTPLRVCVRRNLRRKDPVDPKVIQKMHYQFERLMNDPSILYEEGFDGVKFQNHRI